MHREEGILGNRLPRLRRLVRYPLHPAYTPPLIPHVPHRWAGFEWQALQPVLGSNFLGSPSIGWQVRPARFQVQNISDTGLDVNTTIVGVSIRVNVSTFSVGQWSKLAVSRVPASTYSLMNHSAHRMPPGQCCVEVEHLTPDKRSTV